MADDQGDKAAGEQAYEMRGTHTCRIISSYMPESFELTAINTALVAVDKYKQLKDIAYHVKVNPPRALLASGALQLFSSPTVSLALLTPHVRASGSSMPRCLPGLLTAAHVARWQSETWADGSP